MNDSNPDWSLTGSEPAARGPVTEESSLNLDVSSNVSAVRNGN